MKKKGRAPNQIRKQSRLARNRSVERKQPEHGEHGLCGERDALPAWLESTAARGVEEHTTVWTER